VTVQVTIDGQGKVVEAHALPSPSKYWANKAVEAAKQWRFEPATLHGQSVSSVSAVDFRFNPE
jgi:TonB family protein